MNSGRKIDTLQLTSYERHLCTEASDCSLWIMKYKFPRGKYLAKRTIEHKEVWILKVSLYWCLGLEFLCNGILCKSFIVHLGFAQVGFCSPLFRSVYSHYCIVSKLCALISLHLSITPTFNKEIIIIIIIIFKHKGESPFTWHLPFSIGLITVKPMTRMV